LPMPHPAAAPREPLPPDLRNSALVRLLAAPAATFSAPQPTRLGGLLLLLPALQRFAQTHHEAPGDAADVAALAQAALAALARLRPPPDDPVHALIADLAGAVPLAPRRAAAQARWRALRRWLRAHAGIGLAHLLWRPA